MDERTQVVRLAFAMIVGFLLLVIGTVFVVFASGASVFAKLALCFIVWWLYTSGRRNKR